MEDLNGWQILRIIGIWLGRKIKQITTRIGILCDGFYQWIKKIIRILCKKIFDYITLLLFGTILFFPLVLYIVGNKIYNIITFDEFKELLDIICKSYYIIIMGIIVIFYMFRNSIRKKLEQISEVGNGVVKFELQADINTENVDGTEYKIANDTIEEKREHIYDNIRDDVSDINKKPELKEVLNDANSGKEIWQLEEKLKERNATIQKLKFQNIKLCMAPTTSSLLLYMYNNRTITFFNKIELKKLLSDRYPHINLEMEINAIIYFLTNNKIIETEDDQHYSITDIGRQYMEYIFNGGDD